MKTSTQAEVLANTNSRVQSFSTLTRDARNTFNKVVICTARPCRSLIMVPENSFTGDMVGIGTTNPKKKLHIFTDHTKCSCQNISILPPGGTPGPVGPPGEEPHLSHAGIRIENITYSGDTSVWDIEPEWDTSLSLPFLGIGTPGSNTLRIYPTTIKVSDTLSATYLLSDTLSTTYLLLEYPQGTQAMHIHPAGLSDNIHFQKSQPAVVQVHTADNNRWAMEIVNIGGRDKGLRIIGGWHGHSNLRLLEVSSYSDNRPLFAVYSNGMTYMRGFKSTLSPFPDYVFDPNYQLMPIEEKAQFWHKHRRLPGFPTAQEAQQEVNVNELLLLMVREIEELNIRVYQLWKENQEFKQKLEELTNR